jgi:hypothetical protein
MGHTVCNRILGIIENYVLNMRRSIRRLHVHTLHTYIVGVRALERNYP